MPDGEVDRGNMGQAVVLDVDDKIMAHAYVLSLYKKTCFLFKLDKSTDLFVSDMMINQAASVHNCMRSAETDSKSTNKLQAFLKGPISLEIYGEKYTADPSALQEARKAAIAEVTRGNTALSQKAMGNVQTIFALWQLWGERIDEVIYGSDYKIRSKRGGDKGPTMVKATRYGLDATSRNYWSGLMWSLPVQSSLCQSMGPLAVCVRLSDSSNDKYGAKWRQTFMRHFSFLPYAQDIAKYLLEGTPQSKNNKDLLGLLSKLVCATGARDVQRVAFPPIFLADYLRTKDDIKLLDFSGHGAFLAYKSFMTSTYTVPKTQHMTQLQQIIFHAMFGTHVEDFAVLKFMTKEQNWVKRHEIAPRLIKEDLKIRGRGKDDTMVFTAMPVYRYSKMSGAIMQNLLGGGVAPLAAKAVMSGQRIRKVPEALIKYLNADLGTSGGGMSLDDVKAALRKDTRKAADALSNDKMAGTVLWRDMGTLTRESAGDTMNDRVVEEAVSFHSQD